MIQFTTHYSGSKGNLYSITDGKTSLLLDPGVPISKIKKAMNFKLSGISACLLSHAHLDHARSAQQIMDVGIDLFCSQETATELKLSGHRLQIIQPLKQFQADTWTVLPLNGIHDVPVLNFLIVGRQGKKLLFLIDSAYSKYRFKDVNYIMIGINFDNDILRKNVKIGRIHPGLARRIVQSHMSLKTALQFFKDQDLSKVEAIHVLHCSEANLDKDKAKEAIQRVSGKLVVI